MAWFNLFVCLLFSQWLVAQSFPLGMSFEGSFHYTKPVQHPIRQTAKLNAYSLGAALNVEFQTYGNKDWHSRCRYPRWGVELTVHQTGNQEILGTAIAILPNVSTDFVRYKNFRLFGRLGLGFGIVTKPYHYKDNPRNNMIGSYLNNNTAFRLGLGWQLHPRWELRPSVSLMHFSNAAFQLPNLGINFASAQLSVAYTPKPLKKEDYKKPEEPVQRNKKLQLSFWASLGFREYKTNRGPRFPIYHFSADAGLFITKANRLKLGLNYELMPGIQALIQHSSAVLHPDLSWRSSRISLFIADEVMVGRFSISVALGVYLTQNDLQPTLLTSRFSLRYYFRNPFKRNMAPFVTLSLKAHKNVADYHSIGVGCTF